MKRVATAVVLIPVVLLLVLRAPVPLLAVVVAVVALLSTREFLQLSQGYGVTPFWNATYIYVALLFLFLALNPLSGTPLLATSTFIYTTAFAAGLAPFVFLVIGMLRENLSTSLPAAAASVFGFCYVALPLAFLVQVRQQWAGAILLVYVLLVVWAGDTFAYYIGRGLGRHLMSPRVSPKKTWEGAFGSMLGSLLVGGLFLMHAQPISLWLLQAHLIERRDGFFALERPALAPILLLTAVINVAAQLGDLVESLIKRGAGVKDSGTLLPGHGGMLDRIDALLFAAPVLWYYAAWRVMS
ncbi:MAG TPA: phosphatidate cytidylyltransferase [Terriglobales bacterium]|nr:phosphatidate cytidylyltransferase [Terriglobales bacterium]